MATVRLLDKVQDLRLTIIPHRTVTTCDDYDLELLSLTAAQQPFALLRYLP